MFIFGYIVGWMGIGTILNLSVLALEAVMDVYIPPNTVRWGLWLLLWPIMLVLSVLGLIHLTINSEALREMRCNVKLLRSKESK